MILVSKRLSLRRFMSSDKDDLYEYLSDADVVLYEPYEPFTLDMAEDEVITGR